MEIIVGKLSGFCPGVKNTIKKAEIALKEKKEVYCLGEIIHNGQVIKSLENKGMITVNNIEDIPNGENVIFRAHGEPEISYEKAEKKNLKIIDLTCGNVKIIHDKVKEKKENYFIIILGNKKHPEVIGTKGFSGKNSYVIESEDDILDAYIECEKSNLRQVYIVSQTTFGDKEFDELALEIEKNFVEFNIIKDKTLCNATEKRQKEVEEISKIVNSMVVIGGKHSANSKELAKISEKNCGQVYFVETAEELKNADFSGIEKVGVMAGASTPQKDIDDVINLLKEK